MKRAFYFLCIIRFVDFLICSSKTQGTCIVVDVDKDSCSGATYGRISRREKKQGLKSMGSHV